MKLNIKAIRKYPDPKGKCYLCLDVAFANLGVAVYDTGADDFIYGICIGSKRPDKKNRPHYKIDEDMARLKELAFPIINLQKDYKCQVIFAEMPSGSPNALSSKMMGMAVGVLVGIVATNPNVDLIPIQPNDSKKILGAKGEVSKADTIEFIESRYGSKYLPTNSKREHVADAMMTIEVAKRLHPQYFHKNYERRKTHV